MRTISNILKEKELRNKFFFTFFVLFVCTTLTKIPAVGTDTTYISSMFGSYSLFTYIDTLSGGAISNMSIAAFGISSYITASIIIQLVSIIFPRIETIRQEGISGRKTIERIQFIMAMVFTLIYGSAILFAYQDMELLSSYTPLNVALVLISWEIGTFLVVFLALRIEDYGIGNGISLVLAFNILSRLPKDLMNFYQYEIVDQTLKHALIYGVGLCVIVFLFFLLVIYLQCGIINIPLKQTRKNNCEWMQEGRLPINVNIASVLPIIYATSLLSLPQLIVNLFKIHPTGVAETILNCLTSSNWYSGEHWYYLSGLFVYVLLIFGLGYFSSEMSYNSREIADNMRKCGDIIPGVEPGEDTVNYIEKRRKTVTTINLLFMSCIAVIPDLICALAGVTSFNFIGTSLVIVISVFFDTANRLQGSGLHNDPRYKLFSRR